MFVSNYPIAHVGKSHPAESRGGKVESLDELILGRRPSDLPNMCKKDLDDPAGSSDYHLFLIILCTMASVVRLLPLSTVRRIPFLLGSCGDTKV